MIESVGQTATLPFWCGRFDYRLPAELIAQRPAGRREDARLMVLERATGRIEHRGICSLPGLLGRGDLVVANDSRVIPARLIGRKATGGRVELLVLGLGDGGPVDALVKSSKPLRAGQRVLLGEGMAAEVVQDASEGRCRIDFAPHTAGEVLVELGRVPLPPYIHRSDGGLADDHERYQTVYARADGSVAAPTAGLHLGSDLIERIEAAGATFRTLTLHVGPGTFVPVRDRVEDHVMAPEACIVGGDLASEVNETRAAGGRVVAVGTTSVRALESASGPDGRVATYQGATSLFIRPGYRFAVVDALLTNFHLPRSTLLALVMAFAGENLVRSAYEKAVGERYRFYSYGDAMLVV